MSHHEIPEFRDVGQDPDTGRWRAVHCLTGRPIEAPSFEELRRKSRAVRIALTLLAAPGRDWRADRYWPDGAPVSATQEAAFSRMADVARRAVDRISRGPAGS